MDSLAQAAAFAEQISRIGQKLIDEYVPGTPFDLSNPGYLEIQRLMEQSKDVLVEGLKDLQKQTDSLLAETQAAIAQVEGENAAKAAAAAAAMMAAGATAAEIAAAGLPEPKPSEATPPILAFDFEEKHTVPTKGTIEELMTLPNQSDPGETRRPG